MNLDRSGGPDLLPAAYNESELGPRRRVFASAAERLDTDLRRTLFWTLRLSMVIAEYGEYAAAIRHVPGFLSAAIGFLDPELESNDFGVIVFAAPFVGSIKTDALPPEIYADGHGFPIRVRRVTETLHSAPSHPSGGTGASWATSRVRNASCGPGILTAKHVVGDVLGASVQLSCGCVGTVDDLGPDGIDAAIVVCACARSGSRLYPRQLVAPWTDVTFDGASSGSRSTKVSAVTDTMGILDNSALPSRVFLANPGRAGDSGALVADAKSGEPIGIYMGAYSDPSGKSGGIAQHAYQAAALMDLEIYS